MNGLSKISLAALIVAFVAIAGVLVTSRDHDPGHANVGASAPAKTQEPAMRTLVVDRRNHTQQSQPGGNLHGALVKGRLPARPTVATVTADENCAPDAEGVSHCTNKLRMAHGRKLTVVHPHRMHEIPCMTPGEKVRVVAGA